MSEILVSAIMPTRGRSKFAPGALDCFMSQTYPNMELIIIDDDDDPSFPLDWTPPPRVKRVLENIRYNIPMKLNKLCGHAVGPVIVRFDDDDWSAPNRVETQLELLLSSGKSVTGYNSMVFVDGEGQKKIYRGASFYALGTSLMFKREFWHTHPFKENKFTGSDNIFGRAARENNEIICVPAGNMMYARAHTSNTSRKQMDAYLDLQPGDLPEVLSV